MSVLYGAIGGAIAGALGGALGWGLSAIIWADREPADRPRWLSTVGVVAMLALSRPVIQWWETPSVDALLAQVQMDAPALAALKGADPARYSEVRAAVEQGQAGSITQDEVAQRVHGALVDAYLARLPTAPDALVQVQAQVVKAEYSALQNTPDVCVNYILGSQPLDLRKYLPPNMLAADQDIMARVLKSPAVSSANVASNGEVQKAIAPIVVQIAHEQNLSGQEVGQALQMKSDQRQTCRVYAALFQRISELPTAQSAAITRGLMRMSKG